MLLFAFAIQAQPVIDDVVNAAGRIPSGFPGYGIAQGALFAVTGRRLGPATLEQASYPLPAASGLNGITATVAVGGSTVNAILVYVSEREIGAILPSNTPVGTGTVTVSNNGATASAPLTVVPAAFGIFSLDYFSGTQHAAAFNEAGDGTATLNYLEPLGRSATPGQTVIISGTGLGAIPSDETQPSDGSSPGVAPKVFVGVKPAVVLSAGRGSPRPLPDGVPAFPVPQDLAALDVIEFTVPDGIIGCKVSVAVQIGSFISNLAWIAISADGSACLDPNRAVFADTVDLSGSAKIASVNLLRTAIRSSTNGAVTEVGTETGTANFTQFNVPVPVTVRLADYAYSTLASNAPPGSCIVQTFRVVNSATPPPIPVQPPDPNPPKALDAGAVINVRNATGSAQVLRKVREGAYGGGIGSSFAIPGLPPDNSKLFLTPGAVTANNDRGGADIPAFTASLTLPRPSLVFDNVDAIPASLDRTTAITVRWTGGDPDSFVNITGTSQNFGEKQILLGSFFCSERISAGQFTIPSFILMTQPVTVGLPPLPPIGTLAVWNYAVSRIDIPGVDIALFSAVMETQKTVTYK